MQKSGLWVGWIYIRLGLSKALTQPGTSISRLDGWQQVVLLESAGRTCIEDASGKLIFLSRCNCCRELLAIHRDVLAGWRSIGKWRVAVVATRKCRINCDETLSPLSD